MPSSVRLKMAFSVNSTIAARWRWASSACDPLDEAADAAGDLVDEAAFFGQEAAVCLIAGIWGMGREIANRQRAGGSAVDGDGAAQLPGSGLVVGRGIALAAEADADAGVLRILPAGWEDGDQLHQVIGQGHARRAFKAREGVQGAQLLDAFGEVVQAALRRLLFGECRLQRSLQLRHACPQGSIFDDLLSVTAGHGRSVIPLDLMVYWDTCRRPSLQMPILPLLSMCPPVKIWSQRQSTAALWGRMAERTVSTIAAYTNCHINVYCIDGKETQFYGRRWNENTGEIRHGSEPHGDGLLGDRRTVDVAGRAGRLGRSGRCRVDPGGAPGVGQRRQLL